MKAAQLAGFQDCILLQEPIAASMAYGVDAKDIDGTRKDISLLRAANRLKVSER